MNGNGDPEITFSEFKNKKLTYEEVEEVLQVYHRRHVAPYLQWVAYKQQPLTSRIMLRLKHLWNQMMQYPTYALYKVSEAYKTYRTHKTSGASMWRGLWKTFKGPTCRDCGSSDDLVEVGPDQEPLCDECLQESITTV